MRALVRVLLQRPYARASLPPALTPCDCAFLDLIHCHHNLPLPQQAICSLGEEAHLNTCFKHFIFFVTVRAQTALRRL